MTLTIEHLLKPGTSGEIAIMCDADGLAALVEQLEILRRNGGHVHLMTPSWAGTELTENKQIEGSVLINHLRVVLLPIDKLRV